MMVMNMLLLLERICGGTNRSDGRQSGGTRRGGLRWICRRQICGGRYGQGGEVEGEGSSVCGARRVGSFSTVVLGVVVWREEMGRPVLLALGVVAVGVHGIARIHRGQKQKDIKKSPNLRSHHQRLFLGADAYLLYVLPPNYSAYYSDIHVLLQH